jgi:hypothetical protein
MNYVKVAYNFEPKLIIRIKITKHLKVYKTLVALRKAASAFK